MSECWQGRAERAENIDLARRIVDVVITTNNVGHGHIEIVYHNAAPDQYFPRARRDLASIRSCADDSR